MSDDRQPPPSAPRPERGGWGGEYDPEATGFLPMSGGLPSYPGYPDYAAGVQPGADPLAAPGHGYTPPDFAEQPRPDDPTAEPGAADPYGGDGAYSPYAVHGPYAVGDGYGGYPPEPAHGAGDGYGQTGDYGGAQGGAPFPGQGFPPHGAEGGYSPEGTYRSGGPGDPGSGLPTGGPATPAATTDPAAPGEWGLPFAGADPAGDGGPRNDPYQVGGGPSPFDAPVEPPFPGGYDGPAERSAPGTPPRSSGLAAVLGQGAAAARAGAEEARVRAERGEESGGATPTVGDPWSLATDGPGATRAEPARPEYADATPPGGTPAFGTDWNAAPGGGGTGQWEIPHPESGGGTPPVAEPEPTVEPEAAVAPGTETARDSGDPDAQRRPLADPDPRPTSESGPESGLEVGPESGSAAPEAEPAGMAEDGPEQVSSPSPSVIPRVPSVPGRPRANEPPTDDSGEPGEHGEPVGQDGTASAGDPALPGPEPTVEPAPVDPASAAPEPAVAAPEPAVAAPEPAVAASAADPLPGAPQGLPVDGEHPHTSYILRVNGADRQVLDAWIGESLLYVLRERLGLAGAKDGCAQGECGACSVQVDGRLVASCLVPAALTAGSQITTVEGLGEDGAPSDVQRALAECGAVQCGFCVPGMAMTLHDLLEGNHAPSELEARKAISGNLCRCSGYRGVLDAVNAVAAERAARAAQEAFEPEGPDHGAAPHIPQQAGPHGRPAGPPRGPSTGGPE